jgi:hypothetical protein
MARSKASGRGVFGVAAHHAVFDGTSGAILAGELSTAYTARAAGTKPDFGLPAAGLAELDAAYRQLAADSDIEHQLQYWTAEFSGMRPCHFPGRSTIEPESIHHGPSVSPTFIVEPALTQAWESYARERGMTTFAWVAAIFTHAMIGEGAPPDVGMMFPYANRGTALLDRTIASRGGLILLRPNGPSHAGRHLLARAHDAYVKAMAATDLGLDEGEADKALGDQGLESPVLLSMPFFVFQDTPMPVIKLGDATMTFAPEFNLWADSLFDVGLEVRPRPEGGLLLRSIVRIDLYPADLADRLGQSFLRILADGPRRLEQETASR